MSLCIVVYNPATQYSRTFVTVQHALSVLSGRVLDRSASDWVHTPTDRTETQNKYFKHVIVNRCDGCYPSDSCHFKNKYKCYYNKNAILFFRSVKGQCMFLFNAVSSPPDCSMRFTLYSLADLLNQTKAVRTNTYHCLQPGMHLYSELTGAVYR